jgi:hypothetical protein
MSDDEAVHVYYCICGPDHEDDSCPEHGEGEPS